MLPLNIPELQVEGAAFVQSIEPCPPIAGGDGSVVTALFKTRQVDQIATVEVLGPNGQIETLIAFDRSHQSRDMTSDQTPLPSRCRAMKGARLLHHRLRTRLCVTEWSPAVPAAL